MESEKILSIIIPIFNKELYIKSCLNSIVKQLNEKIEILLIDDCSNDNTQKICTSYLKENIKYIRLVKNRGVSIARNKGIEMSEGKYIWFVDADDFLTDGSIDEILNCLKIEEIDVLIFEINRIKNGKNIGKYIPVNSKNKYEIFDNSPCNKIYRKKILKDNDIYFDDKLIMGEDKYFNLCVASYIDVEKIRIIHKPLYNYIEGIGITSNLSTMIKMLETFQKIFETFDEEFFIKKALMKSYREWLRIIIGSILKDKNIKLQFKIKKLKYVYKNLDNAFSFFGKSYKIIFFYELIRKLIIIIFLLDRIKNII